MNDWKDADRDHAWHPYTQMLTAPEPLGIERAEGVYLYTSEGRRILDGISSWWVNTLGHSNARLNKALTRQTEKLQQVIFAGATHPGAAELAARLAAITPGELDHSFYSDDGSTAVEVSLKMAAQYWRNKGEESRTLFVSMTNSYHGDTFGAMALGGSPVFHANFSDFLFPVRRFDCTRVESRAATPAASLESPSDGSLEEILQREGDKVAAVIIEPVLQGAGGMILWPSESLVEIRELCDRYGTLLIADEVFTGFGRTGRLFACEHGPIVPDIICLSKALTAGYMPLAVTLSTAEIYNSFLSEDRGKTFFHGHSYTANALACAVALENLDILEDENILGRISRIEELFKERLQKLEGLPAVRSTRAIGSLAALDIEAGDSAEGGYLDAIGPRLYAEFLERDILLRPLGNVLYFLPPYVITDDEIHRVFDAIEEVVGGL
ncbi:MAG: adenosylmethionine--8-amino-7-oxononanoate transaminase [Planctomycetota bacterium]|nr:adenosylmethionine--8-amino-7-oxononanoate transaminase [Planctomycetota bacterium]